MSALDGAFQHQANGLLEVDICIQRSIVSHWCDTCPCNVVHVGHMTVYIALHLEARALAGTTPSADRRMKAVQGLEEVSTTSALDDLPDDALKQIFQQLSTEERRAISRTSRKWQRLIAE